MENAGFQLPQKERVTPSRLFNDAVLSNDLSGIPIPENADVYPKARKSKTCQRSAAGPSSKQLLNGESANAMQATILKVMMIPQPGFGCIISLQSKPSPTKCVYSG